MIDKLKYLLALVLLAGIAAPSIVNAWCCRKISWGFLTPPIVAHLGEVFEVSSEQQCLDTCSGSLALGCQNFYRKDATTDTANNACVSATSGCCQVTATSITGAAYFTYSVNDQNECEYYCKALVGCTSLYKKGQVPNTNTGICETPKTTTTSDETKGKDSVGAKEVKLDLPNPTNPLGTVNPSEVIGRIIKALLAIIGSIFLLLVVYGGFTWMTAAGNDAKVEKGRNTVMWAVAGLVVIFLAWMLTGFVLEALGV